MSRESRRLKAFLMLVLATFFWAISFPVFKAFCLQQQTLLPTTSTWGIAAISLCARFFIPAVILALVSPASLKQITRSELKQGAGLAVFASLGLLLQMDGLSYTEASTSAFITQCYCIFIPIWMTLRYRYRPSMPLAVSSVLVLLGVGILSRLSPSNLKLGRGEIETLGASLMFAGQILWVEKREFTGNDTRRMTLIMFLAVSLFLSPLAWALGPGFAAQLAAYRHVFVAVTLGLQILFCTIGGYMLMNYWQPFVTAHEAGLIYCFEPMFASALAVWMPALLARGQGFSYVNESIGAQLILGGGLITAANALVQLWPTSCSPEAHEIDQSQSP